MQTYFFLHNVVHYSLIPTHCLDIFDLFNLYHLMHYPRGQLPHFCFFSCPPIFGFLFSHFAIFTPLICHNSSLSITSTQNIQHSYRQKYMTEYPFLHYFIANHFPKIENKTKQQNNHKKQQTPPL